MPEPTYLSRDQLEPFVGKRVVITHDFGTREPITGLLLLIDGSGRNMIADILEPDRSKPGYRDLSRVTAIRSLDDE